MPNAQSARQLEFLIAGDTTIAAYQSYLQIQCFSHQRCTDRETFCTEPREYKFHR
jgi:hypothetical protein